MKLSKRVLLILLTAACLYSACANVLAQSLSDEKYNEPTSDITYNSHSGELSFDEIDYSDEKAYYTIYNFDSKYYFSIPIAYKGKTASLGTDNIIVQFSPDVYLSIKGNDYYASLTAEQRYCTREEFTLGNPALNETFNNIDYVKNFVEDKASLYSTKMVLRAVSKENINEALFWVFSYAALKDEASQEADGEIRFLVNVSNGYLYFLMINSITGIVNDYPEVMETLYSFNIGYRTGRSIYYCWAVISVLALIAAFIAYELFTKVDLAVYDDAGNKVGVKAGRRELKHVGIKSLKGETQYFDVSEVNKAAMLDKALIEGTGTVEYHTEEEIKPAADIAVEAFVTDEENKPDKTKEQKIVAKTDIIEATLTDRENLLAAIMAQKDEPNAISLFTQKAVKKLERNANRSFNERKALEELDSRIEKIDQSAELKKWAYENMPKEYTFKMKASEIEEARNEITAVLSIAEWADPANVLNNYSEEADLDALINEGKVLTRSQAEKHTQSRSRKSEQRAEKKKAIRDKKANSETAKSEKQYFEDEENTQQKTDINSVLDEILGRNGEVKPQIEKKAEKPVESKSQKSSRKKNSSKKDNKPTGETKPAKISKVQSPEDMLDSILGRNGKK